MTKIASLVKKTIKKAKRENDPTKKNIYLYWVERLKELGETMQ